MPTNIDSTPYLHNDTNLEELTSREMLSALEKPDNRKKVAENMQNLLSNPENKELVKSMRNLCAGVIVEMKKDTTALVRLKGVKLSGSGGWDTMTYADGTALSEKDKSYFAILSLYDQVIFQEYIAGRYTGNLPVRSGWKGDGSFTSAQGWLDAFGDAVTSGTITTSEVVDTDVESLSKVDDEQFYELGKTVVDESKGDIDKVKKAISSSENVTTTNITISGGADEIFMSPEKGQKVLDVEILKLEKLKSLLPSNEAVIIQLINELKNPIKHQELADANIRKDGRDNIGNARLVAARIASGYVEVLQTIHDTNKDMSFTYTIDWASCSIGKNGNKREERKIHVSITLDKEEQSPTDPVNPNVVDPVNPNTVDPVNPNTVDPVNPNTVDPVNPNTVDPVNPNTVDPVNPNTVDPVNPNTVDPVNPNTVDPVNPNTVDPVNPNTVDPVNPNTVDPVNPNTVDPVNPNTVDPVNPNTVDPVNPNTVDPVNPNTVDPINPNTVDPVNPNTVDPVNPNTVDPVNPNVVDPVKQEQPINNNTIDILRKGNDVMVNFPNPSGDLLTARADSELFDKDGNGDWFPNIEKIKAFYANSKPPMQVTFVIPAQTYEKDEDVTDSKKRRITLTDFAIDNGMFVGEYSDLKTLKNGKKGLLLKYADGRMEFTHTDEIQHWKEIPKGVDIFMLGSVKRWSSKDNKYVYNDPLIAISPPSHYIAEKRDGSIEFISLYGTRNEQKMVLESDDYTRVLYLDVDGNRGQLNGYWINNEGVLTYGNHDKGDILKGGKSPNIVTGNMPSILVMTSPIPKKQDNQPVQKKQTEAPVKNVPVVTVDQLPTNTNNIVVPGKIDDVVVTPEPVVPTEVSDLTQVNNVPVKTVDQLPTQNNSMTVGDRVDDVVIDTQKNTMIDPKLESLYEAKLGYDNLLLLQNTVNELILDQPIVGKGLLLGLQQDSFLDIAKYTLDIQNNVTKKSMIEQLLPLGLDSKKLSGVTIEQVSASILKVKDSDLRQSILGYLIVGNVSYVGSLIGMKKNSEYIDNRLRTDEKLDSYMLNNMERKNRVYRGYEKILGSATLSNEFGMTGPVPADVREAYLQFAYKDLAKTYSTDFTSRITKSPSRTIDNKNDSYAIVSKSGGDVYLFDQFHNLVSKKSVLLGKDRSDAYYDGNDYVKKNPETGGYTINPPDRTPHGLYTMDKKAYANAKIGKFMQLLPQDNQMRYATDKNGTPLRAIGFHQIYQPEFSRRDIALQSANSNDKFITNGCINVHDDYFAELRDHLDAGSQVFVA